MLIASHSFLRCVYIFILGLLFLPMNLSYGQSVEASNLYSYKQGDFNGIGKWFMGREIAYVMGYQAMSWLDRQEREQEERTSILLQNMDIQPGDVIADIGAGSGYHVFKMAPLVNQGEVFAVDIQKEMLEAIAAKNKKVQQQNIKLILGSEKSVNLPENSIDKVLMVDVYHEFNFPYEMVQSIKKALRPDGKIYLIEYRTEDPMVPIKKVHKMSEAQAVKEFAFSGFSLEKNISNLPWQHCMVFVKATE